MLLGYVFWSSLSVVASLLCFQAEFYNSELDSSLTNRMESVGMECTDYPY